MTVNKKAILKDFNKLLKLRFAEDLIDLILFGSQATGKAHKESDYDFLIILKQNAVWKTEREISDLSFEIELKYNIITDIHILGEMELTTLRGKQPIFLNAISKGLRA